MAEAQPELQSEYWVTQEGVDTNDGTADKPFATIQHAIEIAQPGATIHIGKGVFYERLIFRRSGVKGKPITLRGASSEGGAKGTRIEGGRKVDPSIWEPAPEIAAGVYKTKGLKEEPEFITVDGKSLARLNHVVGGKDEDGTRKRTAMEVLAWPDGPVAEAPVPGVDVWDALGGAYTYQNGTTFMRLKSGEDVRQRAIATSPTGAVVVIEDVSNIILKDLEIGGGEVGVLIQGKKATHNRIETCRVVNGRVRIQITGGASDNIAYRNYLSMGFLGKLPGPWWSDIEIPASEELKIHRFLYRYFKTYASEKTTSDDKSFRIHGDSVRTTIEENHLEGGIIGIEAAQTSDLVIKNNRIEHHSSVGMALRGGCNKVYVEGNVIKDCNISIRLHEMNSPLGHELYVWNNRCRQPEGVGTQLYAHFFSEKWMPSTSSPALSSTAYIYHNTFSGGYRGFYLIRPMAKNSPRFMLFNNVFFQQDLPIQNRDRVGEGASSFVTFDFNAIIGGTPLGDLNDSNLIVADENKAISITETFAIVGENAGKESGIDLSQPFVVREKSFTALPGMTPGYFSGAKPNLGAVQR